MLTGHAADVCVIGSGPAGALVAESCAARGLRVLLMEAGPRLDRARRPEQMRRYLTLGGNPWPTDAARDVFVNASSFGYPLNANRVRAVGGTTLHWIGMTPRLRESDFETATRFGLGVDWPLSYGRLEPYYVRAERALGVSGTMDPAEPWRSAPFPMPAFADGFGDGLWRRAAATLQAHLVSMPTARNHQQSYDGRPACATFATCTICPIGALYSADWHAFKAEQTGRCMILADTVARRIETDAAGHVRAVHATGRHGGDHLVTARYVVLAASAVESARLLLLSSLGNPEHVGRHLMEHWKVSARGSSAERDYPHRIGFPVLTAYHRYEGADRDRRGAVRLLFPDADDPNQALGSEPGMWGSALAAFDCATFGHQRRVDAMVEHQPHRDSRVTLDPEVVDVFGDPAPNLRFVLSEVDHRSLEVARGALHEMMAAARLGEVRIGEGFYGGAHLMGTLRMSRRAEDGVTDPLARVHGSDNLFVAGSALFPTGGAVNPTLTIAALSLRLADHLVGLAAGRGGIPAARE